MSSFKSNENIHKKEVNLPATGNAHPPCLEPHKIWAPVEIFF